MKKILLTMSIFVLSVGSVFAYPVNDQITDSVTQSNTKVLGEAPAVATGNAYQAQEKELGLMQHPSIETMLIPGMSVVSQFISDSEVHVTVLCEGQLMRSILLSGSNPSVQIRHVSGCGMSLDEGQFWLTNGTVRFDGVVGRDGVMNHIIRIVAQSNQDQF